MVNIELIKKIGYMLLLLFLIYLIIELIRKIFGGSLGFEELVIGLLIANLGYSFYLKESINKVDAKLSGHIGWHKGKGEQMKRFVEEKITKESVMLQKASRQGRLDELKKKGLI